MTNEAPIATYLEIGKTRVFAGAIEWPGWCRGGRDAGAALEALVASGPRYAQIMQGTELGFSPPEAMHGLQIVERMPGNTTTDFGAPDVAPAADARPVDAAELQRFETILQAIWRAFDSAVGAAEMKTLRKGPRGGGRDLDDLAAHTIAAEGSYLARLAWKRPKSNGDWRSDRDATRAAVLAALVASVRGGLPERGPRGGVIWSPRYFVRRVAWHVVDHAWEIEERAA